ncbi:hypothetical protein KPL36_04015 [Clostridium gasigenes]|nr:hypothetical protein [Clostridium gasigenes]MBU3107020.1 hypothetical protein [Clostridium gasigenes]
MKAILFAGMGNTMANNIIYSSHARRLLWTSPIHLHITERSHLINGLPILNVW